MRLPDVMQNQALAVVEAGSDVPLLPFDEVALNLRARPEISMPAATSYHVLLLYPETLGPQPADRARDQHASSGAISWSIAVPGDQTTKMTKSTQHCKGKPPQSALPYCPMLCNSVTADCVDVTKHRAQSRH